jgi:hypothetical protein
MPDAVHFWWTIWERTAKRGSDWLAPEGFVMSGETVVPAGATSGEFTVQILGDTVAEPDEDFTLEWVRSGGPALVIDGSPVTITIVNDDVSFATESAIVASGQRPRLTLVTGPGTGTARLESSDPAVVEVPASVSVGAAYATSFEAIAGRAGTATIRARIDGTTKTASTNITVFQPMALSFEPHSIDLLERHLATVKLHGDPAPGIPQRVLLTSSDSSLLSFPSITTMSAGGNATFTIEGRAAGKARLIALLPDAEGQPTLALNVNVLEAASPSIVSITPASGPSAGGTRITILGANFRSDCTVKLGELFASVVSVDPSSIVAVTPPHESGFADLSVQCGNHATSAADGFQFMAAMKRRAARK